MKNKVLRLAIVAVLVVAMVLSMAACTPTVVPPVDPSPSPVGPSTSPSAPGTTTTPGKPEVGTDEATLETKYGITFPVADGMTFKYGDPKDTVVDAKGEDVKFEAKAPAYNDAFNAYKNGITVTAKVSGLTKEGVKIDLATGETTESTETIWAAFAPGAAGTYTVTYTVKVNYAGDNTIGFTKPAKISETYTVVKTYEVAKKKVTVESVSDVAEKTSKLEFKPCEITFGGKTADPANKEAVKIQTELGLAGDTADYSLSANILNVDTTAYGAYPMNLVCTPASRKGEVVDVATLTAKNYEVTFKNGSRYVLTDAEKAAANAAKEDVLLAGKNGANKDDIALGLSTYNALSEAAKAEFNYKYSTNVIEMMVNQEDLAKIGMVEEALKLAKVWNDKLQNSEDLKTFISYMVSLNTTAVKSAVPGNIKAPISDYDYVLAAITTKAAGDANAIPKVPAVQYLKDILSQLDGYKTSLDTEFHTAVTKFEDSLAGVMSVAFDKADVDKVVKALAAMQAKYDVLLKDQQETENIVQHDHFYSKANANAVDTKAMTYKQMMAKADTFTKEAAARYDAYATLIADLDAYTDVTKVTLPGMKSLLGYHFDVKKVDNKTDESNSAAKILFNLKDGAKEDKYVAFTTPMAFIADATTSFKKIVDAYVALDAAIVEAQVTLMSTLGAKLEAAGNATKKVYGFDGTIFDVTSGGAVPPTMFKYEALQQHLGKKILVEVFDPIGKEGATADNTVSVHFSTLAKKELAEVIAAALKAPVSDMNGFISTWEPANDIDWVAKP